MANKFDNCFIVALGSNCSFEGNSSGDILQLALDDLETDHIYLEQISSFYETEAYPKSTQSNFVNAAALGTTELTPDQLLKFFHQIEAAMARSRDIRWGARTLDLDLILYNQDILPETSGWYAVANHVDEQLMLTELVLPHPRAHKRDFVLKPIVDIAPDWYHPVYQRQFSQILVDAERDPPPGYVKSIIRKIV